MHLKNGYTKLVKKLYLAGRGLKGCLFGTASLVKKEQPEKNWSLFELMDTDNRICSIRSHPSASYYNLNCWAYGELQIKDTNAYACVDGGGTVYPKGGQCILGYIVRRRTSYPGGQTILLHRHT